jgi:hypothetical protein
MCLTEYNGVRTEDDDWKDIAGGEKAESHGPYLNAPSGARSAHVILSPQGSTNSLLYLIMDKRPARPAGGRRD